MKLKRTLLAAAVLATGGIAFSAGAATATDSFLVKINIQASCSVTAGAGSNIDFGNQLSTATSLASSSNISVTCSNSTPYDVGLLPNNTGGTANGTGVMTSGASADSVAYSLWQNSAHTTSWGNTVGTNTLHQTGNGTAQSFPVYATVASANVTPAAYQDTVTVTVTY